MEAKTYANKALSDHDLLFGGGTTFFRSRYNSELHLILRPESEKVLTGRAALDMLWPNKV